MIANESLVYISKLHALFKEKNWYANDNEDFVFEKLCRLIDNFSDEQKELFFELTEDFLWLSGAEYDGSFNAIFNYMLNQIDLKNCTTIYLIPVLKAKDRGTAKSSSHCVYAVRNLLLMNRGFAKFEKVIVEDYEWLEDHPFTADGRECIFLIDDFVGTGNTFDECWLSLLSNTSIAQTYTALVSLILQEEGYKFISSKFGIDIFYNEIRQKGITNRYKGQELIEKKRIMKEIEAHIKPGKYSFGYKESEALVTMSRTPNNTFPVFWKKSIIKRVEYEPPFPRN